MWKGCGVGQTRSVPSFIRRLVSAISACFGAEAEIFYRVIFLPTVNDAAEAEMLGDDAARPGGGVEIDV